MAQTFLPPDGTRLEPAQREALGQVLEELETAEYERSWVLGERERLVTVLEGPFRDPPALRNLYDELYLWVRWYRLQSYWLTYLFQGLAGRVYPPGAMMARFLHSDAQLRHAYEDDGVHSLEVAYTMWREFGPALGVDANDRVESGMRYALVWLHGLFSRWLGDFSYDEFNPHASHPYTMLTWHDLVEAFPDLVSDGDLPGEDSQLLELIDRCGDDDVYCRAIAHRFLGQVYVGMRDPAAAIAAFRSGAEEALAAGLDGEIGHAHRCLGSELYRAGKLHEAILALGVACGHDGHPLFSYWRALNARESGDVLFQMAIEEGEPTRPDPDLLARAVSFYEDGRISLQVHLADVSVLPGARATKLQMMRAYADNSFMVAGLLKKGEGALCEIAANAPNEAFEAMIELDPGWHEAPEERRARRGDRAVFYQHLTSVPGSADAYVAAIPAEQDVRSRYFFARRRMRDEIGEIELSDAAVSRFVAEQLRLPDSSFLFFHTGERTLGALFVDGCGTKFRPAMGETRENDLRALHAAYSSALPPPDVLAQGLGRGKAQAALDELLAGYEHHLAWYFEQFLPLFEGKHLKIFPKMVMNAAPLHAMRVQGKRLIDHCDVSYGQSLPLFVRSHRDHPDVQEGLTVVYGDRVPLYGGMIPQLQAADGDEVVLLRQPSRQELFAAIADSPGGDLFFACHGQYFPDDPMASVLHCGDPAGVSFLDLVTELEMPRFRTVIMGACESSLGRSEIASEFIGLPNIFLAAGVRFVIGSLWKVNQLATAVLLGRCCELLSSGSSPPVALNRAQRDTMQMSRDQLIEWVRDGLPSLAPGLAPQLSRMDPTPFAHPRYWAGFYVQGDV
jgi:CHAT domain